METSARAKAIELAKATVARKKQAWKESNALTRKLALEYLDASDNLNALKETERIETRAQELAAQRGAA